MVVERWWWCGLVLLEGLGVGRGLEVVVWWWPDVGGGEELGLVVVKTFSWCGGEGGELASVGGGGADGGAGAGMVGCMSTFMNEAFIPMCSRTAMATFTLKALTMGAFKVTRPFSLTCML